MKVHVSMQIETPCVPNYLRTDGGQMVPICSVTDDGRREIGAAWTEALIARAHERHRFEYGTERGAPPTPSTTQA